MRVPKTLYLRLDEDRQVLSLPENAKILTANIFKDDQVVVTYEQDFIDVKDVPEAVYEFAVVRADKSFFSDGYIFLQTVVTFFESCLYHIYYKTI